MQLEASHHRKSPTAALNPRIFLSANSLIMPISENLAPRKYPAIRYVHANINYYVSHKMFFFQYRSCGPPYFL